MATLYELTGQAAQLMELLERLTNRRSRTHWTA